jgi:hypothetical protein
MDLNDFANLVGIANGMYTLLGRLPEAIDKVRSLTTNSGFEIKTNDETIDNLKGYLNYKKSKEEQKRCQAILKKHNLPKTVGIMGKSENDICFAPNKRIVDKTLNNLNLKSSDGNAELHIGGGFFALHIRIIESGRVHQRIMCGTVIKHKGEIYHANTLYKLVKSSCKRVLSHKARPTSPEVGGVVLQNTPKD